MATYTTQRSQTYATRFAVGGARATVTDVVAVALTTAMIDNANDEIELLKVPSGAVITRVLLHCTDVDTNGSPAILWDIGDDSDEDRLIAAATVGQSAASTDALASTGIDYKYSADTKIKAYVNTAAATAATGTLTFLVEYFVDPNFTLTNSVVS